MAPTWSWASVIGSIQNPFQYRFEDSNFPVKVLEVHVEPAGDPVTQIKNGTLRVQGRLFPIILNCTDDSWEEGTLQATSLTTLNSILLQNIDLNLDVDDPPVGLETRLHCLLIHERPAALDTGYYSGLLLQPTLSKRGQFRRIGTFTRSSGSYASEDEDQSSSDTDSPRNRRQSDAFVKFDSLHLTNTDDHSEISDPTFSYPPGIGIGADTTTPESWFEYESYDGVNSEGHHLYTIEII